VLMGLIFVRGRWHRQRFDRTTKKNFRSRLNLQVR